MTRTGMPLAAAEGLSAAAAANAPISERLTGVASGVPRGESTRDAVPDAEAEGDKMTGEETEFGDPFRGIGEGAKPPESETEGLAGVLPPPATRVRDPTLPGRILVASCMYSSRS